tara:strand:- start:132 stop:656 length:525 start_codon:yes stop_codon:yes gene_type:complete
MINDLINKFSKTTDKFIEEELVYKYYEEVSKEIQVGIKNEGVWAKAFTISKGDEQKTKAKYIELMVERKIFATKYEGLIKVKEAQKKINDAATYQKINEKEIEKHAKEARESFQEILDPRYWITGIFISMIWLFNTTDSFLPNLDWIGRIIVIFTISFFASAIFWALVYSKENE